MSQPQEYAHTRCCGSATLCGASDPYPTALDYPHPRCPTCTALDAANVPCSLDCPFTDTTPTAMEDHR